MFVSKYIYLLVASLGLLGAGVFFLRSQSSFENVEIIKTQITPSPISKLIKVDISGSVVNSGVYELPTDSRVIDALEKAGGLTAEADTKWIDANLNRAQILVDGQKLFIPAVGNLGTQTSVKSTNEKVSVNSATASELESLPQIGPVTAQKIITNRPYQTIEELVSKKAISQSVLTKIKDLITLWGSGK